MQDVNTLTLATDSEWDVALPDTPWLSTVITSREFGTCLYMRDDIPEEKKRIVRSRQAALDRTMYGGAHVEFVPVDNLDIQCLISLYLRRFAPGTKHVRLLMFYSPKDLEYGCGWRHQDDAIKHRKIRQHNNISGCVRIADGVKVSVLDMIGWSGGDGLEEFTSNLGIQNQAKQVFSPDEKARMYDMLLGRTQDYISYSLADGDVLFDIRERFVELVRTIQREYLGMPDELLWRDEDVPGTLGSLTSRTFARWLETQSRDRHTFNLAIRKVGELNPDVKGYRQAREIIEKSDPSLASIRLSRFHYSAIDAASVRTLASADSFDSSCFAAVVQGGRCNNERPDMYIVDRGADIDISGCYSQALVDFIYPVGLPTVFAFRPNERRCTFGEWIDKHEQDLLDGLWTATVSGKLSFRQDLIPSLFIKASEIRGRVGNLNIDDDGDIQKASAILQRQIINGVITADVWRTLKAVASKKEMRDFRRLELVCAVAYLKRDRVGDLDQWAQTVIASRGTIRRDGHNTLDDRSRAWAGVPLRGYVGELQRRRASYKRTANTTDGSVPPEERARAQGMSTILKFFINTLYGGTASRFFDISNVVVANNITARARTGVWMLAKSLGLRQTITDGGLYDPKQVNVFKREKPSFSTLADLPQWENGQRGRRHKSILTDDMNDLPLERWGETLWDEKDCKWGNLAWLDKIALDHVNAFWRPFGLCLPFELEHKTLFERGAYIGKADYCLLIREGYKFKYKFRGRKPDATVRHPYYALCENLIAGGDDMPTGMMHTHTTLLGIEKYMVIQNSHGYADLKHLRPGDEFTQQRQCRINNDYFPLMTYEDYHRRISRRAVVKGEPVEFFERFREWGWAFTHGRMMTDDLRSIRRRSV